MSELPLSVQSELAEVRAMRDRVRDLESQLRDAVEHAEAMQRDRDAWKAEAEERLAHIILATQERNHARASLALIDLEKASAKRDWYAEIAAIHHGGMTHFRWERNLSRGFWCAVVCKGPWECVVPDRCVLTVVDIESRWRHERVAKLVDERDADERKHAEATT